MSFWTKFVAYSLATFFIIFPASLLWWAAGVLGRLWFDVFCFRRFTVLKNLQIAFPKWSKAEKLAVARQSMQSLCYGLMEFCQLPYMNQSYLKKYVQFHGFQNYEDALAKGKGVLLMSLHLGNGDVAMNMMVLRGLKLNVISKLFKNKFSNDFWFGIRRQRGLKFIEPHGKSTPFDILKACKAKQAVVFVIDQFMGTPFGIETYFFGRKTGSAYGLALFARKTEAPVIPVYTYRDKDLITHIVFESEIPLEKNENRDLQNRQMTQKYNDKIEQIVRLHPEQWMWVHRRWKTWE